MNIAGMEHDARVAKQALEGAIRNIEKARELQLDVFELSMLEAWAYDYEEDHVFPGDTVNDQYLAEYSRRASGELHPDYGYRLEITSEAYEEIDAQGGVDSGLGIALDVLRKMLERL